MARRNEHPGIWKHRLAIGILVIAAPLTVLFGFRSYSSFLLLRSAYEIGAPQTSSVRAWMTLGYVAVAYHVPQSVLVERLGLTPGVDANASLKSLAEQERLPPSQYTQRVQQAIADATAKYNGDHTAAASGWLGAIGNEVLTTLLVYGYPALGLTLLLAAIGLPVPDGLATAVAGSLIAEDHMSWLWAGAVAVTAAMVGDIVGYALGRVLSREMLERHGRWFGYTLARQARVKRLFDRWGSLTVFISHTLISYLNVAVGLLAGANNYRLSSFLTYAAAGRLIWTSAYLGLGYAIGPDLEAATGFLTNLSVLLLLLLATAGAGLVASGQMTFSRGA